MGPLSPGMYERACAKDLVSYGSIAEVCLALVVTESNAGIAIDSKPRSFVNNRVAAIPPEHKLNWNHVFRDLFGMSPDSLCPLVEITVKVIKFRRRLPDFRLARSRIGQEDLTTPEGLSLFMQRPLKSLTVTKLRIPLASERLNCI